MGAQIRTNRFRDFQRFSECFSNIFRLSGLRDQKNQNRREKLCHRHQFSSKSEPWEARSWPICVFAHRFSEMFQRFSEIFRDFRFIRIQFVRILALSHIQKLANGGLVKGGLKAEIGHKSTSQVDEFDEHWCIPHYLSSRI